VSKENVEIVREAHEAAMANEAGLPDEAALNRLFDRDHEFVSSLTGVEGRSYRGLDGYARYRLDMADAWREWRMDVEELIDAGGDTVVAVGRFQARGRTSDVPVDARAGIVFKLRDERILRSHTYFHAADALAAAGLRERTGRGS
jgi:ketosteroid isomerase-like protein